LKIAKDFILPRSESNSRRKNSTQLQTLRRYLKDRKKQDPFGFKQEKTRLSDERK
jgi:hypothetical protein